jgi:hypothetical protein
MDRAYSMHRSPEKCNVLVQKSEGKRLPDYLKDMDIDGRVEVYLHASLISALDRYEWSPSRPSCFTP